MPNTLCVLVFVSEADILNILCDCQFVSPDLMNIMLHTMLDAAGDVLRVHSKSMKCVASFYNVTLSTLFR